MIVIGLTGSIAMGKTETSRMFSEEGIPVFDADAAVHNVYEPGGAAVELVISNFPNVQNASGGIDRKALGAIVLRDPEKLKLLEALVHPLIRKAQSAFLLHAETEGNALAVVDHPLLFESGTSNDVDVIVVVSAPKEIQEQRALSRPDMTRDKLQAILDRQTPDAEKRRRANYIVDSSKGLEAARDQVTQIIRELRMKALRNA